MKRLRAGICGLLMGSMLLSPALAAADTSSFVITNFAADETLTRADPQGELRVVERINVNFNDFNHGILRAIPDNYKHHSLQLKVTSISSDTNTPVDYTTYSSGGNTVLKIGDPDRTVTGPQEYTISYTLHNVISFYPDHDELFWDVNGDQWQQSFQAVSVTLHLPPELKQSRPPLCFTGSFGGTERNCVINGSGDTVQASTTAPLAARQTLTYVTGFQTGYFQPAKWYETLGEHTGTILKVLLPIIVIGGGSVLLWRRYGRDPKGSGIIVPQYDAPDGLKPLAVGTLADFKADNRDITATLIDLAIRGYIKIIEAKQAKALRKDKLSYRLQLVNTDFSALDPSETKLMNGLFADPTAGAEVDISALKNKLYTTSKGISKDVTKSLTDGGYFRGNPASAGSGMIVALIALGIIVFYGGGFLGWPLAVGLIIGGLIAGLCAMSMAARTAKGVAAREHILGLKMYLEVAEKDRLNKLQAPDAKYSANSAEPVKTVDLFEKLLPYAMVLGVEKQWSKQFESLYTSPPDWYSGNWTTFNAYYLATSLNDGIGSAVNTAFTAPSSSGGSGFSGGFSGGGGGGGGGGGW